MRSLVKKRGHGIFNDIVHDFAPLTRLGTLVSEDEEQLTPSTTSANKNNLKGPSANRMNAHLSGPKRMEYPVFSTKASPLNGLSDCEISYDNNEIRGGCSIHAGLRTLT